MLGMKLVSASRLKCSRGYAGYLCEIAEYARQRELRVHMHVSEQPGENEACIQEYGVSPVTWLQRMNVLGPRFTAVHAIHISEAEAALLGE